MIQTAPGPQVPECSGNCNNHGVPSCPSNTSPCCGEGTKQFIPLNKVSSVLGTYLKVTVGEGGNAKDVFVFPGMEYNIKFYDSVSGSIKSMLALVDMITTDTIKIVYFDTINSSSGRCDKCMNVSCAMKSYHMNLITGSPAYVKVPYINYGCPMMQSPEDKYRSPSSTRVLIANLIDIDYANTTMGCYISR